MSRRLVLLCYLLLGAVYLFYAPHAEFVLDDWYMFQKFEQARSQGPAAEWGVARSVLESQFFGTFRVHWLGILSSFGLYQLAGLRPLVYFLCGLLLQAVVAWLWHGVLERLGFDGRIAFLAGALFMLMPTAHNPLFWFSTTGQYVLAAFWLLVYLSSAAGTVAGDSWGVRSCLWQALAATLALFSTDQAIGLVLAAGLWLAICWRSRTGLICAGVAWAAAAVALALYTQIAKVPPVVGSVNLRFEFSATRALGNLGALWADYQRLAGLGDSYYLVSRIGWGFLAAAGAGLVVFLGLRRERGTGGASPARALLFGAGLWAAGYGPIWLLRWRELRYDYLPSLGLSLMLAAVCAGLLRRWPQNWLPAAGALLVAGCAATTVAEIQQSWAPQSRNLQTLKRRLRGLADLRYHDLVVISGAPLRIGSAPHFAMLTSHTSRPFAEMATGVFGLMVGREIYCEAGGLSLEQFEFMHPIHREDLARAHVLVADGQQDYVHGTLLACQTEAGHYALFPLRGHAGPAPAARAYARDELRPLERQVYFARSHHQH